VILRQIKKIARTGYIVYDLRRNWLAIGSMELLVHTINHSRLFCHDARQSCLAGIHRSRIAALAEQAGLYNFQIYRHHLYFHMVLEGRNGQMGNKIKTVAIIGGGPAAGTLGILLRAKEFASPFFTDNAPCRCSSANRSCQRSS